MRAEKAGDRGVGGMIPASESPGFLAGSDGERPRRRDEVSRKRWAYFACRSNPGEGTKRD